MGEKVMVSPANMKRYGFASAAVVIVVVLYLLSKQSGGGDDMQLAKIYETRYLELQSLLDEKDKALNETYKALTKTYEANKMQEETVKDIQLRLKSTQTELGALGGADALKDLETKHAVATEDKKQAEMTVQMCRQEAAAALQEKENLLWQHQQALERAREDVEALQRAVKEREGASHEKELELVTTSRNCQTKLQAAQETLAERERSLHWLVEKKRSEATVTTQRIVEAKSERSCQHDIDILRDELRKALGQQRQRNVVEDIKNNHHGSTTKWNPAMQMPEIFTNDNVVVKPSKVHMSKVKELPSKEEAKTVKESEATEKRSTPSTSSKEKKNAWVAALERQEG
eukprot:CAMPEP_0118936724 /NCGR_PEP_ID=MMETSP1169-20130426/20172_1 /TAXON_ID=36882 /ORGANISM="Pyramimonas obovata, Strain CCMP722" /LENGTH=344 /DNA_ID=CAMNT_0006880087 /DNA_START=40 /DNA_END=1074 /DNA_ORIENTATION=-